MLKAQATVETPKASRYLKALCNHFSHKVTADYTDDRGVVQFGFAYCEMAVAENVLVIDVQADSDENFYRVMHVVRDHLERFGAQENLEVIWNHK